MMVIKNVHTEGEGSKHNKGERDQVDVYSHNNFFKA